LIPLLALACFACRPAVALDPANVEGLSDDFDGDALDPAWQTLNPQMADIVLDGGSLSMTPTGNVVWFMEAAGPYVYRSVTGNFRLDSTVHVRKVSDPTQLPDEGYQFGGIMVRDPASDAPDAIENYVFNVIGWRGDYFSHEIKSTRDDESIVTGPTWDSGDAELRICRFNETFTIYVRPVGGDTWQWAFTWERPDLPATLQAGTIAYALTNEWDIRATFDYLRFAPVGSEADCTAD